MKEALRENWRLAAVALVLLVFATILTVFPSLQAAGQDRCAQYSTPKQTCKSE